MINNPSVITLLNVCLTSLLLLRNSFLGLEDYEYLLYL